MDAFYWLFFYRGDGMTLSYNALSTKVLNIVMARDEYKHRKSLATFSKKTLLFTYAVNGQDKTEESWALEAL